MTTFADDYLPELRGESKDEERRVWRIEHLRWRRPLAEFLAEAQRFYAQRAEGAA